MALEEDRGGSLNHFFPPLSFGMCDHMDMIGGLDI